MPKKQNFMKKYVRNLNYNGRLSLKNKNNVKIIPIGMATDDNYIKPTIACINSLFLNANDTTKYTVIVMVPGDLSKDSETKLLSFNEKFKQHKIEIRNMGEEFSNVSRPHWITAAAYFRLKLPEIFLDFEKVIYLDSDTLVLKDLREFYEIDINNQYIAGVPDIGRVQEHVRRTFESVGIKNDKIINSGVMLWNLTKIRHDEMMSKLEEFLNHCGSEFLRDFGDQGVINVVFYEKILDIHPKFNLLFGGNDYFSEKSSKIYDEKEQEYSKEDPTIVHFTCDRPWHDKNFSQLTSKYVKLWHEYVEKSGVDFH